MVEGLYYVREGGGQKQWSGQNRSHVGWGKEDVNLVLDAEGVLEL